MRWRRWDASARCWRLRWSTDNVCSRATWWRSTASSSRRTQSTLFATATPSFCWQPTPEADIRGGFFGEYLRIDLASGAAIRIAIDPAIARRFIGGVGLGAWLLHQETPRGFDPL